jgi:hypothetical protein
MKLFLVFLLASFIIGLIFRNTDAQKSRWVIAGVTVLATALYFFFTSHFI